MAWGSRCCIFARAALVSAAISGVNLAMKLAI